MQHELRLQAHDWAKHERVIVFDGVCHWCNWWVNFTIDHDPHETLKFGMLQSEQGQRLLQELHLPPDNFTTFLLVERTRVFTKSTAALRIARRLSGFWPCCYLFIVIPRPLRDALYDFVARRRYKWMGKSDTCRVPSPGEQARFV
jgi:predicted DCC family thiol-disulfide oxidoreductase YuxK